MNFTTHALMNSIRVFVVNPHLQATQLLVTKVLAGLVFGRYQLIDLIMLVYTNEKGPAQDFAHEITSCAFPCFNTVTITSDLPSITDAEVFIFITSLVNPNTFDIEHMDSNEQFDNMYIIMKVAASLEKTVAVEELPSSTKKKTNESESAKWKPIIVGDGLLVIDMIRTIAKSLPPEMFYCATPLRSIAKTILSDYLKVECNEVNDAYVWAASDLIFHVEIDRPYLKNDKIVLKSLCDWEGMSQETFDRLKLEHDIFNETWMKRDLNEKILDTSSRNPYGIIYTSMEMAKTLRYIWWTRYYKHSKNFKKSLGAISDGSLNTVKGLPYVLPLIINKDSWIIDTKFDETTHLRHEIKRINQAAIEQHRNLVPYCKKFYEENIINQAFIPKLDDSDTDLTYSSSD